MALPLSGQPGPGHQFTVLGATQSPDKLVEVGDEQSWFPETTGDSGKLSSTRNPAFWADKTFLWKNGRYIAEYSEGKQDYVISLTFCRGVHMTMHKDVWMIYGSRTRVEDGVPLDGPPNWGGQNEN